MRSFRDRDIFLRDGSNIRRIQVKAHYQAIAFVVAATVLVLSVLGILQIVISAPVISRAVSNDVAVARMQGEVSAMSAELASIRTQARVHAARLEQRQAFLDAVLTGKVVPASLPAGSATLSGKAAEAVAPLNGAEAHQVALAERARVVVESRYRATFANLQKVGIAPQRIASGNTGMGGPYEPVDTASVKRGADPAFRALFDSWKRLDTLQKGFVAIPSQKPVDVIDFTSGFGVRNDPFRGGAAMHAGLDIRGPIGTPIHATADGIVDRAGWANGYGNLIELNHGRGIQTRYGHLSAILVQPGQRVKRGDVIARMGSTGRSTGSHLHYEVPARRGSGQPNAVPAIGGLPRCDAVTRIGAAGNGRSRKRPSLSIACRSASVRLSLEHDWGAYRKCRRARRDDCRQAGEAGDPAPFGRRWRLFRFPV